MTDMLRFVSEQEPTADEMVRWMMRRYPSVKSRKTAIGYLNVPRFAGLIEPKADRLTVTGDAAGYLASGDPDELLRIMAARIAGLDEALERVRQSPCTAGQMTRHLNAVLGTGWESDAQASWRLRWLENFGKVRKKGDSWTAA